MFQAMAPGVHLDPERVPRARCNELDRSGSLRNLGRVGLSEVVPFA